MKIRTDKVKESGRAVFAVVKRSSDGKLFDFTEMRFADIGSPLPLSQIATGKGTTYQGEFNSPKSVWEDGQYEITIRDRSSNADVLVEIGRINVKDGEEIPFAPAERVPIVPKGRVTTERKTTRRRGATKEEE